MRLLINVANFLVFEVFIFLTVASVHANTQSTSFSLEQLSIQKTDDDIEFQGRFKSKTPLSGQIKIQNLSLNGSLLFVSEENKEIDSLRV